MGLLSPTPTRERTYVNGTTVVNGNDLNTIQDVLIMLLTGDGPADWVVGEVHFTDYLTHPISGYAIVDINATHTRTTGGMILAASANPIEYPMQGYNVGDTIGEVAVFFTKTTSGARTITVELRRTHEDGTDALVASDTNSENSPGATFCTVTVAAVIAAQWHYYIRLVPSGFAGDKAWGAHFTRARP